MKFKEFVRLDAGGPVTRQALKDGYVDVALLFTTDPAIERDGLVELVDDRGLQPAENVIPLVRTEVVERFGPELVKLIDAVSARADDRGAQRSERAGREREDRRGGRGRLAEAEDLR